MPKSAPNREALPKKAADTIGRFARGKIARMEVDKLKKNKMEEITSK